MTNYLVRGFNFLQEGIIIGAVLYIFIFLILLVKKQRRHICKKNIYEMLFSIWTCTIFLVTGLFSFEFSKISSWRDNVSFNLIPFVGGSIVPIVLNFLLFVPFGFLLPLALKGKWNWKKAFLCGGLTSFFIEIIQLLYGRYAELDDLLLNSFGTLAGYGLHYVVHALRTKHKRKNALCRLVVASIATVVGFSAIYLVCDHNSEYVDGLMAVDNNIEVVRFYHDGKWINSDTSNYIYLELSSNLANCGGHILEMQDVLESEVLNDNDYYIEILFAAPQTISFYNSDEFVIEDSDRLIYNTNTNTLYWGNGCYQKMVEYTKLEDSVLEYKNEIMAGYKEFNESLKQEYK